MVDNTQDAEIFRQCLRAAVDGPFFCDCEFHTLLGLERDQVRRIVESWPEWDDVPDLTLAINNSVNNLLSYPHDRWNVWHDYITATPAEVGRALARFRHEDTFDDEARGSFDRML